MYRAAPSLRLMAGSLPVHWPHQERALLVVWLISSALPIIRVRGPVFDSGLLAPA